MHTPEVTASVEAAPPDSRPEPGKFQKLFLVTWWQWHVPPYGNPYWTPEWRFAIDRKSACLHASRLHETDCRSIRIITIPGESQ